MQKYKEKTKHKHFCQYYIKKLLKIKSFVYLCTKKKRKDIKWTRDLHHVRTKRCLPQFEHFRHAKKLSLSVWMPNWKKKYIRKKWHD